jgi:hypothetical protein
MKGTVRVHTHRRVDFVSILSYDHQAALVIGVEHGMVGWIALTASPFARFAAPSQDQAIQVRAEELKLSGWKMHKQ